MSSVRYSAALLAGLILVNGLLVACSSPGRSYTDSKLQETLETEILPNTSKMFVLLPSGQNTTCHPPPVGIINVLVWSSNA